MLFEHRDVLFPPLYRCGHIEGSPHQRVYRRQGPHFRIFIDAASLKATSMPGYHFAHSDFRIFIDAATLKEGS